MRLPVFIRQVLLLQQKDFRLLYRRKLSLFFEILLALIFLPIIVIILRKNVTYDIFSSTNYQLTPKNDLVYVNGNINLTDVEALNRWANISKTKFVYEKNISRSHIIFNRFDSAKAVLEYQQKHYVKLIRPKLYNSYTAAVIYDTDSTLLRRQMILDSIFLDLTGAAPFNQWKFFPINPVPHAKLWNNLVQAILENFIIIIIILVQFPLIFTVRDIMAEREADVRIYMISMGVQPMADFFSQLISASWKISSILIIVAIPVALKLSHTALPFMLLVWLFAQFCAAFALLAANIFNRFSFSCFFIIVMLVAMLITANVYAPVPTKLFLSLLNSFNPAAAFMYAAKDLKIYEAFDTKIRFFGLFPTFLTWEIGAIMILVDTVLVSLICLCIDEHLLRESSLGRIVANAFHRLSGKLKRRGKVVKAAHNISRCDSILREGKETETREAVADICVKELVKRWPNGKLAVDNVSFDAKRGNITVLLGHNGAGKSTTFACLTGYTQPTNGRILLCGYDMSRSKNRANISYCPQNNPLFHNMTVYDHMLFYLRMRKSYQPDWHVSNQNILRLLDAVGLSDSINQYSQNLSGGMKRKLFIALALAENACVVLLDEPTAGLDPIARQKISKLLMDEKMNRTILLTTHYMDEADLMGDRVVIMASGNIVCDGSPNFLKRRFSAGYLLNLTFVRNSVEIMDPVETAQRILACVRRYVRGAQFVAVPSNNNDNPMKSANELEICLPFDERKNFAAMFTLLEEHQTEYGIETFGLSFNSLEQVFIKVNEMTSEKINGAENKERILKSVVSQLTKNDEQSIGMKLFFTQLGFLLWRHVLYAWRHKMSTLKPFITTICFFLRFLVPKYNTHKKGDQDCSIYVRNMAPHRVPILTSSNASDFQDKFTNFINTVPQLELWKIDSDYNKTLIENYLRSPPIGFGIDMNGGNNSEWQPNVLLFNPHLRFGADLALNAMSNALLYAANLSGAFKPMIRAGFYKKKEKTFFEYKDNFKEDCTYLAIVFTVIITIVVTEFVKSVTKERVSNFQHQIFLTKVTRFRYWLAQYIADFVLYSLVCVLCIILTTVLVHTISIKCTFSLIPLLLLYFFCATTLVYIISSFFHSPIKALNMSVCWMTILPLIVTLLIHISFFFIRSFMDKDTKWYYINMMYTKSVLSLIFPSIAFHDACYTVFFNCQSNVTKNSFNFFGLYSWHTEAMNTIKLAQTMIFLIVSTVLAIGLLCIIESRTIGLCLHRFRNKKYQKLCRPLLEEEEDVTAERHIIASHPKDYYALAVLELYKFYKDKVCAVRNLTFGINSDECFGLLGTNGAGKTSTFDILTAVAYPTAGKATTYGMSITTPQNFGYCPQFDALMNSLTGRETLLLISRLNGFNDNYLRVNKLLELIRLESEADNLIRNYSGGQKRRISLGVAIMSGAKLIMLDEPTAGVDPLTRRHIWDLLSALRHHGTAILLTTHSMEECEALCTKVGFMSKGALISIGTNQHLKSKFGSSFLLTIRPRTPSVDIGRLLNERICEAFDTKSIADSALDAPILSWQIPRREEYRWSSLYRRVDALIAAYDSGISIYRDGTPIDYKISDYSIVQSSMAEVFARLASI